MAVRIQSLLGEGSFTIFKLTATLYSKTFLLGRKEIFFWKRGCYFQNRERILTSFLCGTAFLWKARVMHEIFKFLERPGNVLFSKKLKERQSHARSTENDVRVLAVVRNCSLLAEAVCFYKLGILMNFS